MPTTVNGDATAFDLTLHAKTITAAAGDAPEAAQLIVPAQSAMDGLEHYRRLLIGKEAHIGSRFASVHFDMTNRVGYTGDLEVHWSTSATPPNCFAASSAMGSPGVLIDAPALSEMSWITTTAPGVFWPAANQVAVFSADVSLSGGPSNGVNVLVGLGKDVFGGSPVVALFRKLTADTNWQCVTANGSTPTIVDSGIPAGSSALVRLTIAYYGADRGGPKVKFWINEDLVAAITTHLPADALAPMIAIVGTASNSTTLEVFYASTAWRVYP